MFAGSMPTLLCWNTRGAATPRAHGRADARRRLAADAAGAGAQDNDWDERQVPAAHQIGCNAVSWAPASYPAAATFPVPRALAPPPPTPRLPNPPPTTTTLRRRRLGRRRLRRVAAARAS